MGNGGFGICEPRYAVLFPRHRGCGNIQEFRLRPRIEKPPEHPHHRTRRPERDLPQDIQRHHAVQARQGRLVHRVRPFTITRKEGRMRIFQYMRRFFQMMTRMRKVIHIVSMTCRNEQRKNGLVPVESYKRETDQNLRIRSIGTRHSTRYSIVLFTAG